MNELLHRFCVPCDQTHPGAQRVGTSWYRFKDIHCLEEMLSATAEAKRSASSSEATLSAILDG